MMKHISLLIKPASSLCNMRCRYCFYHDVGKNRQFPVYGFMNQDTMVRIIDSVFKELTDNDEITFGFQGGEPTLAGLSWFENFTKNIDSRKGNIKIHYALQTNGLLIDEQWAAFLRKNDFLVGLSIDANARFHDKNRVTPDGQGTFEACMQCKTLLEKYHVEYNVLCVLTNELAKYPDKVWNFITNENIRFIQFIPCLESLHEKDISLFALRPPRFARFYARLYLLWAGALERGTYISVKLFDDTVNYFFCGNPSACGINGHCHAQYVVEADGSVFPCDFYALDNYKTGNLVEHTLSELFYVPQTQNFIHEARTLPGLCRSCPYLTKCGGGCKRMLNVMYCGSSGMMCGYKSFLDKCLKPLEYMVGKYFS
jgi:uncharacterized protein